MSYINAPVIQFAYVVKNIREAADRWVRTAGAGPFFAGDHTSIQGGMYRGEPSRVEFTYAIGYSGDVQIELVEQHNDAPSVYKELIDRCGEGYHHFMPMVPDYDQAISAYAEFGVEPAFTGVVPGLGRVAYLDGQRAFGGFIEMIDMCPALLDAHKLFKSASIGWNGRDPFRVLSSPTG